MPTDVAYPTTSPGWVLDPTGTFSAYGNRLNVTLLQVWQVLGGGKCREGLRTSQPTVAVN